MVSTLRPKASETPRRPMPTSGKPAAMTALPHPAKVSQKVPIASAEHLRRSMVALPSEAVRKILRANGPSSAGPAISGASHRLDATTARSLTRRQEIPDLRQQLHVRRDFRSL